jgi:hypothetical protein
VLKVLKTMVKDLKKGQIRKKVQLHNMFKMSMANRIFNLVPCGEGFVGQPTTSAQPATNNKKEEGNFIETIMFSPYVHRHPKSFRSHFETIG